MKTQDLLYYLMQRFPVCTLGRALHLDAPYIFSGEGVVGTCTRDVSSLPPDAGNRCEGRYVHLSIVGCGHVSHPSKGRG